MSKNLMKFVKITFVLLITVFIAWGCSNIVYSSPTITLPPEMTSTVSIFIETESIKDILVTDLPTVITTTPVPTGVFALLFYPPLTMNYDRNIWKDESQYIDRSVMINYLQASSLASCQIGVVGPSGNFPTPDEVTELGNVRYQVTISENKLPGSISALYIEDQSLNDYDYKAGLPVLMILANSSEWDKCKALGEMVLSTLHIPSN